MLDISKILERNGFKVTKTFDYKIIDTRLKKGYNIINKTSIYGHKQFEKWIKLIGTNQPKNMKKIKLWKEIRKNSGRRI